MLTNLQAKKAKPQDKKYSLSAGKSLFLLVTPAGGKHWKYRYRIDGKAAEYSIGGYPDISLEKARDLAADARLLVKKGIHPKAHKQAQKKAEIRQKKNTFQTVAKSWLDIKAGDWSKGHLAKVTRTLEVNVYPYLGDIPVTEILPLDVLEVLRIMEKRGAFELTSKVHQRIRSVFSHAIIESMITSNPAADLKPALKKAPQRNYSHIGIKELPELLNAIDNYEGHPITKYGLKLMAATFLRSGEIRTLEWTDISEDGRFIEVRLENMKMKQPHIVPLSNQAASILESLKDYTEHSKYILTQENNHHKYMSENTMLFALYRMGYKNRMTVHGFRHVASTALNEMGFRGDLIEKQLAHGDRDKIRAVYNKAQYLPERVEMMQSWSNYLDSVLVESNCALSLLVS